MLRRTPAFFFSVAILLSVPASSQFSHNPSFGLFGKKNVTLRTRIPPIYNASGKTVDIVTEKLSADPGAEVETAIEQQLTQGDSTIRLGGNAPDLVIQWGVSRYAKPVFRNSVQNGITKTDLIGSLSVTYRIFEPNTKRVVRSDIATSEYVGETSETSPASKNNKLFGLKLPGTSTPTTTAGKSQFHTDEELRRYMIAEVAKKVASALVITQDSVDIPLAVGGTLDAPERFAVSGLWARNLEELSTLTPYPDARVDAYRLYDIAVANEALAYQATDNAAAQKYLDQASINYGKAVDAHPDEKNIREAQNRINSALSQYAAIAAYLKGPKQGGDVHTPKPDEGILTNDDVIAMVKNHLDEANIIDTIQSSPDVKFDLGAQGQIGLAQAGVNGKVIAAMKARARTPKK